MMMAYLDIAGARSMAALQSPFAPAAPAREQGHEFSAREWTIVRLAREDSPASLREESAFQRFLRHIFGFERTTPLASPRLESLRRLAVMSWHHGYNVNNSEISAFLAAGYSIEQYDALLVHIGRERAASARRNRFWGTRG